VEFRAHLFEVRVVEFFEDVQGTLSGLTCGEVSGFAMGSMR
jgi:hypothetical protein